MDDEPAGLDLLLVDTLAGQMLLERIAAVSRITQPKGGDRLARQTTIAEIGPRLGAGRRLQPVLEELRSHLHHVLKRGTLTLALLSFRIGCRQRNSAHVGNALDRLGEAQALEFGEKAEMIACHSAAETVVAALLVLAVKARRVLAMKGTARPIVTARDIGLLAIPRHMSADHVGNRDAIPDLVEK